MATQCAEGEDGGPRPELSVVIPVYNGGADFVRCLRALAAAMDARAELIVVDDGSSDDSAWAAHAAGAHVLATPRPRRGPAWARNLGAATARGEILLFIDADVAVAPDTIARVAAHFRQTPSLAALFGSYDAHPAAPNFLSQYKNLFHHYVHQTSRAQATTFWSGCGAIRRDAFCGLGGFDAAFFRPAIEDIELGARLTLGGHDVRLCHDLQVTHLKRWTPLSLLRADIRDRGIPWTVLLLRERTLVNDLNLRRADRVSVTCAWLLVLALAAIPFQLAAGAVGAVLATMLLCLNLPLYRFFWGARGPRFMLAAIPWHWLYFVYSGACVIAGLLVYLRGDLHPAPQTPVRIPAD